MTMWERSQSIWQVWGLPFNPDSPEDRKVSRRLQREKKC